MHYFFCSFVIQLSVNKVIKKIIENEKADFMYNVSCFWTSFFFTNR